MLVIIAAVFLSAVPAHAEHSASAAAEISAARKVRPMHYYSAYPWWWHQPHLARVQTNYVKWQNTYYEGGYDAPQPSGVVGYTVIGPLWW
jgi:hypothetical protein